MAQLARTRRKELCVPFGCGDTRGVVYVEFLIAFIPVFLLFLGICQLILLSAARLIVSHSAANAVRSAIVVLEDTANDYGGAPRGSLSKGKSGSFDCSGLLGRLGINNATPNSYFTDSSNGFARLPVQHGARMAAIRLAATTPLLTLAPKLSTGFSTENLERSLVSSLATQLAFAYGYTEAATAVTVQRSESSDELAVEPIDPKGSVTVKVAYIYQCGVPVVRGLMCRSLSQLLDSRTNNADSQLTEHLSQFAAPMTLKVLGLNGDRYTILTARATMTNQGANYATTGNGP